MMLGALFCLAASLVVEGPKERATLLRAGICEVEELTNVTSRAAEGKTILAGSGSGVFICDDGYLLTNHHVVDGAKEVVVVFGGKAYGASVVRTDKEKDLALLKIVPAWKDVVAFMRVPKKGTLEVGQTVYAMGYPRIETKVGLDVQVTKGMVANLKGAQKFQNCFQMDAAITHGNSGGPVVNEDGRLVGLSVGGMKDWTGGNYAISLGSIEEFASGAGIELTVGGTVKVPRKATAMLKDAMACVALVVTYQENDGTIELAALRADENDSQKAREIDAAVQKMILQARLYKVRKDWEALKELTEGAKIKELVELNELAKKELQKKEQKETNTTKKGETK